MNHPLSPGEHPLSSVMSELDSLSDSDWLDIASGRDSDDDSLSDQDSDRDEISSRPRSRRSSISNDESVTSDVEAWEGFVSDSGDEASEAITGMYTAPAPSPLGAEPVVIGFNPTILAVVDEAAAEEDKRVREALDQSFVGTLSASSRSINATGCANLQSTHTSIRDLRLSFPDPLTSSRDELNRSYETVPSPTETSVSSSTDNDENDDEPSPSMVPSPPIEDPGLLSTTPEVQHHEARLEIEEKKAELEIVLYGTSSEIKWKFVQELIHNATTASGYVSVNSHQEEEQIQSLRFISNSDKVNFFNTVDVLDRTNAGTTNVGNDNFDFLDRPSLAIVYLPTAKLPVLGWHDAYLPVAIPSSKPVLDNDVMLQSAEDDWDLLAVPCNKVLKLGTNNSPIFTYQDAISLNPSMTLEILRGIGRDDKKMSSTKQISEQVKSVKAVKLFAIMSIIIGFAMNTALRPSAPAPTPTVNSMTSSASWSIFAEPNGSITNPPLGSVGTGSSETLKEMALSVFKPGSTSLSLTPPPASKGLSVASTSAKEVSHDPKVSPATKCHQCHEASGSKAGSSEKPRVSTDVAVRSTSTSLSKVPFMTPSVSTITPQADGRSGTSIILGGSQHLNVIPKSTVVTAASAAAQINLNTVFDATTKALAEVVGTDLNEIAEAADVFVNKIFVQTDNVIRQSKGKARALGEQIQEEMGYRNKRAKRRAKELGDWSGGLYRDAKEVLKQRTTKAQRRAKKIKDTVIEGGVEAWKTYEKVQEEWEGALLNKGMSDTVTHAERGKGKGKENIQPGEPRGCMKDRPSSRSTKSSKGGRLFRRGLQVDNFL